MSRVRAWPAALATWFRHATAAGTAMNALRVWRSSRRMFAFALSCAIAGTTAAENVIVFVGATVIDGTGNAPLRDAVVWVTGERISAVRRRTAVSLPSSARVVDATGKWMVPGLIDAHVHLFQSGGLYTRPDIIDLRDHRPYADEIAWVRDKLPTTFARYIASGITAIVDLGGPLWTFDAREQAARSATAPRVAVAGPLITTYAPEELDSADPPLLEVGSVQQARRALRRVLGHHPDLVKVWFIPRLGWPLAAQTEIIRAAIEASHAAGIRVAVHATDLDVARAAVQAGADILAHSVDDKPVDQAFIDLLRQRDVIYIPTLMVAGRYQEVLEKRIALSDFERRLGDPWAIASFQGVAELPFWRKPWAMAWPDHRLMLRNLKRIHDSGIRIAAGSDAGNIGTLHGPSLHHELELMAVAGLSPMVILQAATRGGAAVLGRSSELGTIEPGKLADFLLLDADPLLDVRHLQRIHRVVKGGQVLDARTLTD